MPSPPRPSQLDAHVGFWLRFVSNHVSAGFRALIEARGVTVSEWVALRALYDAEALPTASLVTTLGMTKGAVSKIVRKLEARGLARRATDADDARAQHLSLTPAGRRLVPQLAALADENDARFFGSLSSGEREALVRTLRSLVHANGLTELPTE